ncbi:MAG: hypothetical protein ACYDDF_03460 [Thermoplasmatota archaeon]
MPGLAARRGPRGPIALGAALAVLTAAVIVSGAAVTIHSSSYAEDAGVFIRPYYENLNAPVTGCTSPCLTVDTQATTAPKALALDGNALASWSSGASIPLTATTASGNDVVVLWVVTYASGSSITVSSVSDSQSKVTWQGSARHSFVSCSGAQETTETEWYGIAASSLASDTVTITLSGTPTAGQAVEAGFTGANTAAPFDPNAAIPLHAISTCTAVAAPVSASGIATTNPNDILLAFMGAGTSLTETHGQIAGASPSMIQASGDGTDSIAVEELSVAQTQSSAGCSFGVQTTYWGIMCDAIQQDSGSFSLSAGAKMDLWSPAIASGLSLPTGSFGMQLFADLPAPAVDGTPGTGTVAVGGASSFTITSLTTSHTNDVIVLSLVTYSTSSTISVSSISDTAGVTWQNAARSSFTSCSGLELVNHVEWYGTIASAIASDTITVTLGGTATAGSGIAFGVSGANTAAPFDPNAALPASGVSACSATAAAPTVSGVSTTADTDLLMSFFGGYTTATETAGTLDGVSGTVDTTVSGVGDSNAVETAQATASGSSFSCTFGLASTYWGALCDAIVPAKQTVTVTYATTNSAGTVQSTMVNAQSATITAVFDRYAFASSAGTVPANGYILATVTAPAGQALTVHWGYGQPSNFQITPTFET